MMNIKNHGFLGYPVSTLVFLRDITILGIGKNIVAKNLPEISQDEEIHK